MKKIILSFQFFTNRFSIWCFFFFMSFARFQILISEPQSIWRKLLVLSWLYKPPAQKSRFLKNHLLRTSKIKIMKWNVLLLDTQSSYILRSPQNFAQSSPYFCLYILTVGKSKVDILQNFVGFSEYMNFTIKILRLHTY